MTEQDKIQAVADLEKYLLDLAQTFEFDKDNEYDCAEYWTADDWFNLATDAMACDDNFSFDQYENVINYLQSFPDPEVKKPGDEAWEFYSESVYRLATWWED